MPPAGAIFFGRPVAGAAPPASDFRKLPDPHGEGPLVERRHGQARTAAPSLGPYVPYSALAGLRRDIKGMLAPIGPLRTGFRPPPPAPTEGGRWLRTAAAPGLRLPPALRSGVTSGHGRFPSPPAWLGLSPPALARRCAAAPAPRSPRYAPFGDGSGGVGTRSFRSPLGCYGWSYGPPSAPQRAPSRPFCASASAGPPRTAPPAPCPRSSLAQLVAWAG